MAHLSLDAKVEVDRNSGPRHWLPSCGFTVFNSVAVYTFFVMKVVDAIFPTMANQPVLCDKR